MKKIKKIDELKEFDKKLRKAIKEKKIEERKRLNKIIKDIPFSFPKKTKSFAGKIHCKTGGDIKLYSIRRLKKIKFNDENLYSIQCVCYIKRKSGNKEIKDTFTESIPLMKYDTFKDEGIEKYYEEVKNRLREYLINKGYAVYRTIVSILELSPEKKLKPKKQKPKTKPKKQKPKTKPKKQKPKTKLKKQKPKTKPKKQKPKTKQKTKNKKKKR